MERPKFQFEKTGNLIIVSEGQYIQDAIDMAEPGDTVLVKPGTYHETLTVDISGLTLLGRAILITYLYQMNYLMNIKMKDQRVILYY